MASLSFAALAALNQGCEDQDHTTYAANGKDPARIRKVLKVLKESGCRCKQRCGKTFSHESLSAVCNLFWSLSKTSQDALLWSLSSSRAAETTASANEDSESEAAMSSRRRWTLDGHNVCRHAFVTLLGISNHRLSRTSTTPWGRDSRSSGARAEARHIIIRGSHPTPLPHVVFMLHVPHILGPASAKSTTRHALAVLMLVTCSLQK